MTAINWEALARSALHPIQLQIIERMASRPDERFSPVDLAESLSEPLPNLAYHVRQLANQGLLAKAGTAPRRGAVQHFYRASKKLLA
jgi:DNA-binding MarR family transcriptional regulator